MLAKNTASAGETHQQFAGSESPFRSLNYAQLVERCLGDEDLARRVLLKFRETFPEPLQTIQVALADEKWDEVARQAHRLKGAAANLSAFAVQREAAKLNDAAAGSNVESCGDCFESLTQTLNELSQEIEQYLAGR